MTKKAKRLQKIKNNPKVVSFTAVSELIYAPDSRL